MLTGGLAAGRWGPERLKPGEATSASVSASGGGAITSGAAWPKFPVSAGMGAASDSAGAVMTSDSDGPKTVASTGLPCSGMVPGTQARMSLVPSL